MKKVIATIAFLTIAIMVKSQVSAWIPGTVCSTCIANSNSNPKGGGNNSINNGNGIIVNNYTLTQCGLGYVQASKRLGRRNPLNGSVQPATFTITGIPACAIIDKAWVYFGGVSGGSTAVNVTIVNPQSSGGAYPAAFIGSAIDMCWGYGGTRNYRADVTPQISGNGVYTISGIPTNPPTAGQDMNGATLLIIYHDPLQTWTGHIVIGDGAQVGIGGTQTGNVNGFLSCAASTSANAFYMVADMQNVGVFNMKMNSAVNNYVYPSASQNWWDFVGASANAVTAGQSTFPYGMSSAGDCYDIVVAGLYWQTTCNTCIPTGMANATATCNGPICQGSLLNLSVVHNATVPVTFTWTAPAAVFPGNSTTITTQNPSFANAQPSISAIYTVQVEPQGSCIITRTVAVSVYPNPTITAMSNNGPVCQGTTLNIGATANTSASVIYSWTGPNAFTANTLSASITNVMPVASGFYSLTVTNSFTGAPYTTNNQTLTGCSTSGQMSAAIVPTGTLSVTPFFTICQNTNLNLTATGIGVSPSSYSWASSTTPQFTSTLQNPTIPNVNAIHSGDYSVTAYYTSPITTLVCQQTAVSNVSVVPRNPVTPFSSANVCQYTTGSFSATALNAAGYQWTGPNGFTSNNQINTITNIQPAASGNYTVLALFTIGTVTCTTTNYIPLNVIPVPSVAVIPNITVCEREGATFNASAPNAISYMWNGPNSFTMNSPGPVFANLTPSMSGAYTVTAAFSNGNLTCYNSAVTNLLVKPILPFNLGPDKLLCSNSDLFLNGPSGATAYNWWGSTSYTSNTQGLFVPALTPANSGVYVLEVDLNGCKTYDSVNVRVLTPIIFTLTPSNRSICRGDDVNFVVGAAQGSENYAYTWNPAISITGPTGSVQAGNPLGTTVYNISAYDIACPNYVIQTSFTLTVKQPPQPNISIPKNNVCEPMCGIYNTHTQADASAITYDFGNGKTFEGDSISICLPAGQYYMHITAQGKNGCTGTYDYTNSPITVYPKPGADFSWTPDQPTTANNNVTFNPSTKYGNVFAYEWAFTRSTNVGGIDSSTAKNPQHLYDNNGKFPAMLVVKNEYGCIDSVYKVIIIDEDVAVYIPNTFTPNDDNINDVFNIKGLGLKPDGYVMQIFDRWGTLVYTTRDINKGWDGTVKGQKAEDGVYIYSVKVIGDNGVGKKEFKGHVTLIK
jgi:gliding motility-associated-like protein